MKAKIIKIFKWTLGACVVSIIALAIAIHPTISLYIKPAVVIIVILFFSLSFYILDNNQIRKMWNDFIEELDTNKDNTEWLLDKQKTLLNLKHTNIFRKGVYDRMYNQCIERLAEIEANNDRQFEDQRIEQDKKVEELKTALVNESTLNEKYKAEIESLKAQTLTLSEAQKKDVTPPIQSKLKLNSRKGIKTDFLKVVNALHALDFFYEQEQTADKAVVFKEIAIVFSIEKMEGFHNLLCGAYDAKNTDASLDIFDRLKDVTVKIIDNKLNK